jgi:hypothetical protein
MTTLKGKLGLLLGGVGAVALLGASIHQAAPAQNQTPKAKLTPWAAMDIANKQVHGKPLSANYELDEGHWLYDVMIVKGNALNVVEVDANTGKANKPEASTPEEEAKELVSDLNKALGKPTGSATVQGKGEKGEKPD